MEAIRALTEQALTADSKFKIYNYPPALPHKCIACGAGHPGDENIGTKRAFIDTGMSEEFYGVIYICTLCFVEIANTFGYVSPKQYAQLNDKFSDEHVLSKRLKQENEALRAAISALSDHRCVASPEPNVAFVAEGKLEEHGTPEEVAPSGNSEKPDSAKSTAGTEFPSVRGNAAKSAKPGKFDPLAELGI